MTISSGAILGIDGDIIVASNASTITITIDAGAALEISGDFNSDAGSKAINGVTNNGTLAVQGDLNFGSGGNPAGSSTSSFYVGGTVSPAFGTAYWTNGGGIATSGVTSTWSSYTATVLPIELLNFSVERISNHQVFTWSTASELNNHFYTIENSTDLISFNVVKDSISGSGTSTTYSSYSYNHENHAPSSTTYYRLKQTDFDGSYSYSDIIAFISTISSRTTIYPNPVTNIAFVNSDHHIAQNQILLTNKKGELIDTKMYSIKKNQLNFSNLPDGVYFLKIEKELFKIQLQHE